MEELYGIIIEIICDNANKKIDKDYITKDTKLIEDLGYDSIALMQLVSDIEDELKIDLTNNDLLADKLDTPEGILEIVRKSLK